MTLPIQHSVRSHQLSELVRNEITAACGYISFARFMELALYAPQLGYYNNIASPFGREGDFITAPFISPLFTRCIAQQFQIILAEFQLENILEVGAGSGVFAKDALLELEKLNSLPAHYFIYEISPALRDQQKAYLQMHCAHLMSRIQWLESLPQDFSGIIFANEVMDALPVHCFCIEDRLIKERCVAFENNQFVWRNVPASTELVAMINQLGCDFANGYESEINLSLKPWLQSLADSLKKGVIFLFDYGYGRSEYYHPERWHGTLKCFFQHRSYNDPLLHVGLQDITAHVDFTAVAESALQANLSIAGYTTQAGFLLGSGLLKMAEQADNDPIVLYQQGQAIKKLILPSEMGELVKVMGLTKAVDLSLAGFTLQDRRRDL